MISMKHLCCSNPCACSRSSPPPHGRSTGGMRLLAALEASVSRRCRCCRPAAGIYKRRRAASKRRARRWETTGQPLEGSMLRGLLTSYMRDPLHGPRRATASTTRNIDQRGRPSILWFRRRDGPAGRSSRPAGHAATKFYRLALLRCPHVQRG